MVRPFAERHALLDEDTETRRDLVPVRRDPGIELRHEARMVHGGLRIAQVGKRLAQPHRVQMQNCLPAGHATGIMLDQTLQGEWMSTVKAKVGEAAAGVAVEVV